MASELRVPFTRKVPGFTCSPDCRCAAWPRTWCTPRCGVTNGNEFLHAAGLLQPAALASEELGTTSKVATVNAALRRVANQRAAARMLELLDETSSDLSDEALRGAWRDGGRG